MKRISVFDVLIVYSSSSASSAANSKSGSNPFANSVLSQSYADSYAYFLDECSRQNLKAGFTTLSDICGAGQSSSYWLHDKNGWSRHHSIAKARVIFDKCSPRTSEQIKKRKVLFSSNSIIPFNEAALYNLFFDKLSLHDKLYTVTIPTVGIKAGDKISAESAIARLQIIKSISTNQQDFGEGYVLKDRYGSGGNNIFQILNGDLASIQKIVAKNKNIEFVLQPILLFEHGFSYKKSGGRTEIRLIFMKEKLIQVYLRVAGPESFLCNSHQGGEIIYIPISRLSTKIREAALNTIELLPPHNSLYSLDFVVSDNGNPYLLEGNTGPGLNWDENNIHDIKGAKKVMRVIVKELSARVVKNKLNSKYLPSPYSIVQNASTFIS